MYHTIGGTLWHWALATSTADADTVDNIALLGLVTQTACLIRTRWAGSTVDDVQLSKLYYALSAKFNECIARHNQVAPRMSIRGMHSPPISSCFGEAHLPAADSEKESQDIGLLLLLKFFNVFEGTHL